MSESSADPAYAVKDVFRSLQGEGAQAGTPMVFVRFAGCNLWNGRPADQASARCDFCDTDFVGGERLTACEIEARLAALAGPRWVCLTGGEPLLQLDTRLVERLRRRGYHLALETNGTLALGVLQPMLDWICVSPKTPHPAVTSGNELKLIYRGQPPEEIHAFEALAFDHFSLQPEWGPRYEELLADAIRFVARQPRWRLSLQMHKIVGIP